jgi:opacity protein-like surface antigen
MKKLSIALALLATLPVSAHAETKGWYGGPFALVGFTDNDSYERTPATALPVTGQTDNNGVSGGAGFWGGYDMGPISFELAGSYRARHDMNFSFTDITTSNAYGAKSNVQQSDIMASILYDIPLGMEFQPYIGGGAGMAFINSDTDLDTGSGMTSAGSSSDQNFAWQLQAGFTYPVGDSTDFRMDYRFIDLGRVETPGMPTPTNDRLSADTSSNDIRLGVVFAF